MLNLVVEKGASKDRDRSRSSIMTEQIDAVVNCTLIRVKNNTKLTNFKIKSQIE